MLVLEFFIPGALAVQVCRSIPTRSASFEVARQAEGHQTKVGREEARSSSGALCVATHGCGSVSQGNVQEEGRDAAQSEGLSVKKHRKA